MQDRLTRRGFDPELEFCAECDYHGEPNGCNRARGNCSAYAVFTDAYVRLAAYEDTGLTPDEIAALRAENDMLKDTMIRACVWLDVHGRPGIPDVTRALSEAVASTVKKEAHNEP